MTLIIDNGRVFRPAGYRVPSPGETYLSRSAKISLCSLDTEFRDSVLVLRELIVVDPVERKVV